MSSKHDKRRERRAELLAELDRDLPPAPAWAPEEAGARALAWALEQWASEVREPRGRVEDGPILGYVHRSGWSWVESYQNKRRAWCGHFAASAWAEAGVKLAPRSKKMVSTYRLSRWAGRSVPLDQVRPGDLIVVGSRKDWGDHITIAIEPLGGGAWATVEGNAGGEGPSGDRFEGVIRRTRSRGEIRFAYRPLAGDLEG